MRVYTDIYVQREKIKELPYNSYGRCRLAVDYKFLFSS